MKKRRSRLLISLMSILFLALPHMVVCAPGDFQSLIGRWQRTDAGYVIDIRSIADGGKIAAGYFNPRPINVERAQASKHNNNIKFEMTLRDVGYPGSAYTLAYVPDKDALIGYYYHAVSGQHFEVFIVRQPKP